MPMPVGTIFRPHHPPHMRGHYHKYKIHHKISRLRGIAKIMSLNASREAGTHKEATPKHPSGKMIFAPTNKDAQYLIGELSIENLHEDPLVQFHEWFEQASKTEGLTMPEATTLATSHMPSGRVSARMVYLKELDSKGFVIYSNWETSRKAEDLRSNNNASLCFFWKENERQVRIEGYTERLTPQESQEYYKTRIRGSRIGAWASRQSSKLKDRAELEDRVHEFEKQFEGQEDIPLPPHWGGMRIVPTMIEFWQGRDNRLHDRFVYKRQSDGSWDIQRVAP
ncbi:hypothetical protein TWF696_003097 [Orbilia brochopaga]|uniref:pyridoxal 5'-phosphate synthase n=1 Tax=Orbilia brochopaga TaxID=3140254 RepID=A0AAV9U3G3_9PEZI